MRRCRIAGIFQLNACTNKNATNKASGYLFFSKMIAKLVRHYVKHWFKAYSQPKLVGKQSTTIHKQTGIKLTPHPTPKTIRAIMIYRSIYNRNKVWQARLKEPLNMLFLRNAFHVFTLPNVIVTPSIITLLYKLDTSSK